MSEQHESDDTFESDVESDTPVESGEGSQSVQGGGSPRSDENRKRSAEVLDLIAGVEKQLEQMKNAQSACIDEIATLEERKVKVSAREQATEQRVSELDAQDAEIETMRQALEKSRSELETAEASLKSERETLQQDRERITAESEQASRRIEAADAKCIELKTELATHSEELKTTSVTLEKIKSESLELSSKLEEAAGVIESRDLQVEEARAETASTKLSHAEMERSIASRESELSELQDSFDIATERLQALANAVAEQAPRLEEGAASAALCQQQEERIQSLGEDLEKSRARVKDFQKVGDGDEALVVAREELERIRSEMEDSIPADEHERVVSSLQSQLSAAVDGAPVGDGEIHEELSKVREESKLLKSKAEGFESSMKTSEERLAALQERNEQLERMCENDMTDMPKDAVRLRDQAQRLSSFAAHLQRRRGRLRDIRSLLHQRRNTGSGSFEAINDDMKCKSNQEDLLRRRHELADLESRMLRRWARYGTVSTVLRATFLIVVIAGASWFSVRLFSPGLVSASALVRAQPITGGVIDDERASSWNEWHDSILKDELFAGAVATRLADSPAGFSEDGESFHKSLSDNLEVETVQPGLLQLRLYGRSRAETVRRLEGVVATLSSESQRQISRRGDGARVEVLNRGGKIVTLDHVPISSNQVQNAGIVFGGSLLGIGLFGAAIYSRLSRSRRIFDENVGFDEDELD